MSAGSAHVHLLPGRDRANELCEVQLLHFVGVCAVGVCADLHRLPPGGELGRGWSLPELPGLRGRVGPSRGGRLPFLALALGAVFEGVGLCPTERGSLDTLSRRRTMVPT